jgi:ubiquinone/menaquinone biosynthesis C-methylase UbiE
MTGGDIPFLTSYPMSSSQMQGNVIPFPNCMFDLVINNQVMEHVQNIDAILSEIHRVLKPNGIVLRADPRSY